MTATDLTHIAAKPHLPGHTFPVRHPATFEAVAYLWCGGNSPSESKLTDPEFRNRVEDDLAKLRAGATIRVGAATVWGITAAEFERAK